MRAVRQASPRFGQANSGYFRSRGTPNRVARSELVLAEAEALALAALAEMPPQSWGIAIGGPLAVLVHASTAMGKFAEASRYLGQPVPEPMFESVFGLDYLHARGRFDLATNRAAEALDSFQACGHLMMQSSTVSIETQLVLACRSPPMIRSCHG